MEGWEIQAGTTVQRSRKSRATASLKGGTLVSLSDKWGQSKNQKIQANSEVEQVTGQCQRHLKRGPVVGLRSINSYSIFTLTLIIGGAGQHHVVIVLMHHDPKARPESQPFRT